MKEKRVLEHLIFFSFFQKILFDFYILVKIIFYIFEFEEVKALGWRTAVAAFQYYEPATSGHFLTTPV